MSHDQKEISGEQLEWKVKVDDGLGNFTAPVLLRPNIDPGVRLRLVGLCLGLICKVWKFLRQAWNIGIDDPRKFIHGLKVGAALTALSLFYYLKPLYNELGRNSMWAVLTVVVVLENNVGATLSKCINRMMATFLAGALAVGVHWVGRRCGEDFEPILIRSSVFLLAVAATFSRFMPSVKVRFDYGASIFILTFTLVSVSGYRVDNLFELAKQRFSTIVMGAIICILVSVLICPIWAGQDLHFLIARNMGKLADSLDGCVAEYFKEDSESGAGDNKGEALKRLQGYKCILNSKGTEDSLANFARWEPAHGRFSFGHPWKQYLKVGSSMRGCASCIEALNACINSEIKTPEFIKKRFNTVCLRLSSHSSTVLRELSIITKTMRRSSTLDSSAGKMKTTVKDLQNELKSLPTELISPPISTEIEVSTKENSGSLSTIPNIDVRLVEVVPLVTMASLLIEITVRIEGIIESVNELSGLADFKLADTHNPNHVARREGSTR